MTEPLDTIIIARDDALLDALGRGESAPEGDEVAAMLAVWRTSLAEDTRPVVARRRFVKPLLAAAAVVLLAAGLGVAARGAGPNSPLWPITRTVYSGQADSRIAERDAAHAIALARTSINDRRYADAERHLDEAVQDIAKVRDKAAAQRLLREVNAVRGLLPGSAPAAASAPPASHSPTPSPEHSATSAPSRNETSPTPSQTPGGLLPDLPLPNPLPSLLDPLLPSLPPLLPG